MSEKRLVRAIAVESQLTFEATVANRLRALYTRRQSGRSESSAVGIQAATLLFVSSSSIWFDDQCTFSPLISRDVACLPHPKKGHVNCNETPYYWY